MIWKYAPHSGLVIGDNVQLGEYCIVDVPLGGELTLGDRVKLSMGCVIAAQKRVEIGRETLLGEYCSLRDGDHGMDVGSAMRLQPFKIKPVCIGRDVWLGRGVAVLRGAEICDGVVVGANAVVLAGVVPARAVCVGSPCRVVKCSS
ncbi:MAG: acyltransferase [Nitrososphaerales archaeon]